MSDSLAHFFRSSLQITGGGGLTSIDAIFNLIPDAISNLKTIASFFASFAVLPKFMPGISYWSQHAGGSVQYTQLVVAVTSRYSSGFFWKNVVVQTKNVSKSLTVSISLIKKPLTATVIAALET